MQDAKPASLPMPANLKQVYSASKPQLIGYADADLANDEDDRKSYPGLITCYDLRINDQNGPSKRGEEKLANERRGTRLP